MGRQEIIEEGRQRWAPFDQRSLLLLRQAGAARTSR